MASLTSVGPALGYSPRRHAGTACRKNMLRDLGQRLAADERRSRASNALLQSFDSRLEIEKSNYAFLSGKACPLPPIGDDVWRNEASTQAAQSAEVSQARAEAATKHRLRSKATRSLETIEHAYDIFVNCFERDGKLFGVEELLGCLQAFKVLDDWLTPSIVKDYFTGCANGAGAPNYGGSVLEKVDPAKVSWQHFEAFLRFAADMKGVRHKELEDKLLNDFQMNSDQSTSMTWRLKIVFEAFGKQSPGHLRAIEFVQLLRQTGIVSFEGGSMAVGDALELFDASKQDEVDFDGFMEMLLAVGRISGIGRHVYSRIAEAVEKLDNDEFVVVRMRLNLKDAATQFGIVNWNDLFAELDPDDSGLLSWQEFLDMCRNRLALTVKEWDMRLLFRKLDADGSGELDIQELIAFISEGVHA